MRCAMAELHLACRDRDAAQHCFDIALAAAGAPAMREAVEAARNEHGV